MSHLLQNFIMRGYIAIYFNGELINKNKAKYLFKNQLCHNELNLLIIKRIVPLEPKLFEDKGFFPILQEQTKLEKRVLSPEQNVSLEVNKDEQVQKKTKIRK